MLVGLTAHQSACGGRIGLVGYGAHGEDQAKAWVATMEKLAQEMAPYAVGLTPEERKHTLKFRPGGEPPVHRIALPCRGRPVTPLVAKVPTGEPVFALAPVNVFAQSLFNWERPKLLYANTKCSELRTGTDCSSPSKAERYCNLGIISAAPGSLGLKQRKVIT
jgi:hypothetical protein